MQIGYKQSNLKTTFHRQLHILTVEWPEAHDNKRNDRTVCVTSTLCFALAYLRTIVNSLNILLISFSAISFLAYGLGCFFFAYLKQEFERYHLKSLRVLVGVLQLCAAFGLLAGINLPWLGRLTSAALALMMLAAVSVRIKIKDSLLQTLPALFYMLLNAYICLKCY